MGAGGVFLTTIFTLGQATHHISHGALAAHTGKLLKFGIDGDLNSSFHNNVNKEVAQQLAKILATKARDSIKDAVQIELAALGKDEEAEENRLAQAEALSDQWQLVA